jgi:hypothetical protein
MGWEGVVSLYSSAFAPYFARLVKQKQKKSRREVENYRTERRKWDRWVVARRKEMSELGEVILKTW